MAVKTREHQAIAAGESELAYQDRLLPGVSRTFALTIPVLPGRLARVVTNAYLLCRVADSIEDDPGLHFEQKDEFQRRFLRVVKGKEDSEAFARQLAQLISPEMLPSERELVCNVPRVIRVTHALTNREQDALARCVALMCHEMSRFQRKTSLSGLEDIGELTAYCYAVAGCVGEMLTDLFLHHCQSLERQRSTMRHLARRFGQGLQMVNILKDLWEDRRRGICWLPRSLFQADCSSLDRLEEYHTTQQFQEGFNVLIAITHWQLQHALTYTCRFPEREQGIRQFCLWTLGLAVMTLRKIHRNPTFRSGDLVKVSRGTVWATRIATKHVSSNNERVHRLFGLAASPLPKWSAQSAT